MTVQEAKDFLVEQATQQASLDVVSLSDLEKRMMYFTESADATEDPSNSTMNSKRITIQQNTRSRFPGSFITLS